MSTTRLFTPAGGFLLSTVLGLGITLIPSTVLAANPDCTLIVPANPLTAQGLATPYQLVATNPANGPCHETNAEEQSAFVQAAVIDPFSGKISIYNPLVIDKGATAARAPVLPALPLFGIVALWFGFNGGTLTLQGATPTTLSAADCHQGLGQFAYCNAATFFTAADADILFGVITPPALGFGKDFQPCPTVRSFAVVDQDQSDNLPTTYLVTASGKLAQDTAITRALFPGSTTSACSTAASVSCRLGNPSDNRLTDKVLDGALACTPWTAPDLADPGFKVSSLPLNELHAGAWQAWPVARIPLGDPFVQNDLTRVNEYRAGVNQAPAIFPWDASTTTYCANLKQVATQKLILDRLIFTPLNSPFPNDASNLFTFMARRLNQTYDNLSCDTLLGQPNPVTLIPAFPGKTLNAIIQ